MATSAPQPVAAAAGAGTATVDDHSEEKFAAKPTGALADVPQSDAGALADAPQSDAGALADAPQSDANAVSNDAVDELPEAKAEGFYAEEEKMQSRQ